jgi:alkanesulfonate monooxygenase SsuD/methylene tetrahydromethanopterin reductase-like flavin-dependent oxidoreductase (luciferase family)
MTKHLEQVELGFASVWVSQHFVSDRFLYVQPVPLLARVAAAAEGMTVGTAIVLLTLPNPVEVAENAATLDAIAGAGLSSGWESATGRSRTRRRASARRSVRAQARHRAQAAGR